MKWCLYIAFWGSTWAVFGQQLTHYTQQPFNQVLVNPAFAGNAACAEMKSVHRSQWVGIDDAPKSTALAITGRLGKPAKDKLSVFHGFALKFENDRFGPFQHNRFHAAYAIHLPFKNEHFLSFGTYFGVDNITFDNSNLNPLYSDPAVQNSRFSFMAPDFVFGTKYNTKRVFFALALQNFAPLNYPIGIDSKKVFHANFSSGAQFDLGKSDWTFSPMINVRMALRTPMALDFYSIFTYRQDIYLGAGFRNQESLMFLMRFKVLGRFKVGYSFDWILNSLRGGMGHTHEISLSISACKERKKGATICPVFE
jgi:type IX secretion system PorP/SprF family membrane protein